MVKTQKPMANKHAVYFVILHHRRQNPLVRAQRGYSSIRTNPEDAILLHLEWLT